MKCAVCFEALHSGQVMCLCLACSRSYDRSKIAENSMWSLIAWSAERSRKAERKRMKNRIEVLEEKLRRRKQ